SVDVVGTDWSSFEPVRSHSISTVKIAGSFISGLERSQGINRLVVETVIHMAHSLGMSALVECVETPAQVSIVREFNADAAQGFFFAKPMSSEDATLFGKGPEVPQFSCTDIRTLVEPHPGPIPGPGEPREDDGEGSDRNGSDANGAGSVDVTRDGGRDELDSLPQPRDADRDLPPPFSSPLAINPLRHESV
ncbi:MAG: EAL domain-containing protein, partial [Acidimicrobiales bacterium]|nr:EAL domain-containing protein [Acidimicrobiales bacterium]